MRMMHRRLFTLLEVMIALGLTVVLLTILSSFYQQAIMMDAISDREEKEQFTVRYLGARLAKILPTALGEKELKKNFLFFTSNDLGGLLASNSPSLLFVFESGPSMDPERSYHALGRLYLNRNQQLCLATWATPENWKYDLPKSAQQEVLMENVEQLSFQFYVAPERDRSLVQKIMPKAATPVVGIDQPSNKPSIKPSEKEGEVKKIPEENLGEIPEISKGPEHKGKWVADWRRDYGQLPAMMKVIIKRKGVEKEILFAFPLPNSPQLIVYE